VKWLENPVYMACSSCPAVISIVPLDVTGQPSYRLDVERIPSKATFTAALRSLNHREQATITA